MSPLVSHRLTNMNKILIASILFVILLESDAIKSKTESLCDRPIISAADRMSNNTVRLYSGQYYWILNGLPADVGSLDGPHQIPYKDMGSIFRNNSIVTLLGGTDRGKTVKTEGKAYWMWDERGNLKTKKEGTIHNRFPSGGFDAVIHDGNPDDPTLIGFKGIKTYYLSTRYRVWTIDAKPSGYIGGKYKENFPTDVTAAFSLTAPDQNDEYIVYFFQKDKFCKRTKILESGQQCDEWLPNRKLFGCDSQSGKTSFKAQAQESQNINNDTVSQTKTETEPTSKVTKNLSHFSREPSVCFTIATALMASRSLLFL